MKCSHKILEFIFFLIMGIGILGNARRDPCQFSLETWSKSQPGFTDQLTHKLLKSPEKVFDALTCLEKKAPQDACVALGRALAPHRSLTDVRNRLLKLTTHLEGKRAQAAWFALLGDRDYATRARLIAALHNDYDEDILSVVLLDLTEIKESLSLDEQKQARIGTGKILSQFNIFKADNITESGMLMDAMEIYLTGAPLSSQEFSIIKEMLLSTEVADAVVLNGIRLLLSSKHNKGETRELLTQIEKTRKEISLLNPGVAKIFQRNKEKKVTN